MKLLMLMALLVPCARAQVVAWRGGDSTLSDEAGIGATIYFPNDTSTVGGGFEDGSFRFGAATTFDWKGNEITAGDATQSFNTSIGAGTYLASRGLTVIRKRDKWRAAFFMGGTGNTYSSPFFQATQPSHFGTGFMFARTVGSYDFSAVAALNGNLRTVLVGGHYKGTTVDASAAVGIQQNQRIFEGQFTYRPGKHFNFNAAQDEFAYDGSNISVSSLGAYGAMGPVAVHGTYLAGTQSGYGIGADLRLGPVQTGASYFGSRYGGSVIGTVSEKLPLRLMLIQVLSDSNGSRNISFGGSINSNLLTASVGYQTYFMPLYTGRSPFQQALTMTVSVRLPHSSTATVGTNIMPNGAVKWSAYGSSYTQGKFEGGLSLPSRSHDGKYSIDGIVKDEKGTPVEGALIRIGKDTVLSDSDGRFFYRTNRNGGVTLAVDVDDFSAPGKWTVKTAPSTAAPGTPVIIIVGRL